MKSCTPGKSSFIKGIKRDVCEVKITAGDINYHVYNFDFNSGDLWQAKKKHIPSGLKNGSTRCMMEKKYIIFQTRL